MSNHTVGYFSAYYRGLECLLAMWPKIREAVPDATLNIAYGWESWIALEGKDAFYQRMEAKFKELDAVTLNYRPGRISTSGIYLHDRLGHGALADLMQQTQVWAYPTEFTEIHCITALKAQEAGCYPVVTNVAALAETVQCGDKIDSQNIYSNDYAQSKFIKAVVVALKEQKKGTPVPNCDWADVAKVWEQAIK